MGRLVVFTCLALLSAAWLPFLAPSGRIFPLISGILVGLFFPLFDAVSGQRNRIRYAWYSIRFRKHTIRLSLSCLFRIHIDNKYLLVKSRRAPVYIPVGGVYKTSSGAKTALDEMGVLTDDLVPIDAASQDDLRVRVPGSQLVKFIRWFDGGTSRETSPWREFHEELVKPGLLDAHTFPWVFHNYVKRCSTPPRFSPQAQSLEILIADVYELLPSAEQLQALRDLQKRDHPDLIWVTEQQIRRSGATPGLNQSLSIGGPVSQWII